MKRSASNATLAAYLGILLLLICYFPGMNQTLERIRILHALWHVAIFVGAAMLVYGLETLRLQVGRAHRTPL